MSSGELGWAITASALVLLMTPGVAFFYGGLVKAKSVVSMMMMSFGALGLISVLWILYGFNMSTVTKPSEFSGNPLFDFALGAADNETLVRALFGATFAILAVALISGAIADRAKFGAWLIFAGVWATLVYFPVSAWVWGGGWIKNLGASFGLGYSVIDYAGGTAVHVNAGAAALALAIVLGKRVEFRKGAHKPHNVPLVLLGAAILWFGWFGFNVGAEYLHGMAHAGLIAINTLGATAAAIMGWLIVEKIKGRKPTAVGASSGAVAGLVAITPSCANLLPGWGLVLGLLAGVVCALAVELKYRFGFDDSLDVVGIHMVGGLLGTLYLGFFATGTGMVFGGGVMQLAMQAIAAGSVLLYSFCVAYATGWVIHRTVGFRVTGEDELAGIDTVEHGEEGYVLDTKGGLPGGRPSSW